MDALIPPEYQTLTSTQQSILAATATQHKPSITELTELLGHTTSRQSVSRATKALAEQGYVEIQTDPEDERYRRVTLTQDGEALVRLGVLQVARKIKEQKRRQS